MGIPDAPRISSIIRHPSSLDLRHAKINKDSQPKSTARRHIRAGLNSNLDCFDT
jgi:hypothetical protein